MFCHLHCMLVVFSLLLTLTGSFVNAQTTEVVTEITATTADPPDPCASNPCTIASTHCVAAGESHTCECRPGYFETNGNCTVAQQFAGSFSVTQVGGSNVLYSADLADTDSAAFASLAADVEDALDTVYQASTMADIYLGSEVWGVPEWLYRGRLHVLFATEDAGQPVLVNSTDATEAFTTALAAEAANLGITIDDSTITVSDFDECASADDNDCDPNANCTNTAGSFTCECDTELYDNSPNTEEPGRVCIAPCDPGLCTRPNEICNNGGTIEDDNLCKCIEGYDYTQYGDCDPMARSTDFRCYHCEDSIDNVKCNGRMESENGTARQCPNPTDTCYQTIQMNPEGDGFMIRKGCMNLEDCYDLLYSYEADPAKASCFEYIFPYGQDTPPGPGVQCHYCCSEYFPLDLCNYDSIHFIYGTPRINSWDPRMNWDLSMNLDATEEPESGSQRHLPVCGVLSLVVTTLLALMLH
ncbi:63 kDa sperm flagellar membrane protein precursor [Strongylocentrotus purpuratus]|uniref:63 kDa sperm flagellar membrane protein n=1 Tax=Strongylocentrotus purpuratus TaxID=7668 RepID=SP63_STRPU|nr:63 kDa sperm flagellar membrane protein precursor [Strongylocentrotus purpuratus]Q07929.1 RecName: Full=63 kDa sperm flagellar membrane protein; Flags: Precursor [Strongylocentrotus purpuratus]AAA30029.1 63 kD protein [Strongylocentrotus purpuratus]|eukprot:NP_999632.1 63 kDa sperm flagellar membrane protein precursor [Strongylocentrotus purpuratus]